MHHAHVLLSICLACLAIGASAVSVLRPRFSGASSIALTQQTNTTGDTTVYRNDVARAQRLFGTGGETGRILNLGTRASSFPIQNQVVTFTAPVNFACLPGTTYNLIVDTGSSNTWTGAAKSINLEKSKTCKGTGNEVDVLYGSGAFEGNEYIDNITLFPALDNPPVARKQSIAVATFSEGFDGFDGILGMGPEDLTEDTRFPDQDEFLTVPQTLGLDVFSLSLTPNNGIGANGSNAGFLNLGSYTCPDSPMLQCSEPVSYTPITNASPANAYWGMNTSMAYGTLTGGPDDVLILSKTSGIVDSGTTLTLISSSAFQAYLKATNGTQDQSTGQIIVTPDQFKQMKNFCFIFDTTTGETSRKCLTPDQQVWPTSQYAAIGGKCGNIYLVIADIGSVPILSGSGIDFIAGQTFQQAYYTEYGLTPNQIGFAARPINPAEANYDPNFTCPTSSGGGGISL